MKQDEGKTNEVEANPYNRKKYWHTEDVMPKTLVSADSGTDKIYIHSYFFCLLNI